MQHPTHLLTGKRFISTRPTQKSETLKRLLANHGAELIELPMIETCFLDSDTSIQAIKKMEQYQWLVLTSANAVTYFLQAGEMTPNFKQRVEPLQIAAIGTKTAEAIAQAGFRVDFVSEKANSTDFAATFSEKLKGKNTRILWPTSNLSHNRLRDALTGKAQVDKVTVYSTLPVINQDKALDKLIKNKDFELIYFFSPSAFESFYEQYRPDPSLAVASIGPATTAFMQKKGVNPVLEASTQTEQGIFEATIHYLNKKQGQ